MHWDEIDISRRLCQALDTTRRAIALFAERGYTDSDVVENSFGPDKPIAEAAMLLYAASGARRYADVSKRIDDFAGCLAQVARSKRIMLSMALRPWMSVELAVPHILLSRLGFREEQFDDFLQLCLDSQASKGHERPPFASLEKLWILELWNNVEPGPEWQSNLKLSALNRPIDILGGLKEDAYALTHLVIYCTNFGFSAKRLPRPKSEVLAEARSLLAKCLDEEDYDLAAETLMIWPQLGVPFCTSSAFGFWVLLQVERQAGILPSVRTKSDRLGKLEGEDKTRYAFATAYHTALVMGLLCAVSLHKERTLPTRLKTSRAEKPLIDKLCSFIDEDQGHWQPIFAALPESQRLTLAPLLLDIALAQKFRRRDYNAASQLLEIAVKFGIAQSPLSVQASEMIERLSAFSKATGDASGSAAGSVT